MLEGVEMGSMNGRGGGAGLGELSSLGEAAHLDSFAPAPLVYATLFQKTGF